MDRRIKSGDDEKECCFFRPRYRGAGRMRASLFDIVGKRLGRIRSNEDALSDLRVRRIAPHVATGGREGGARGSVRRV
jgi:hypothetical protein